MLFQWEHTCCFSEVCLDTRILDHFTAVIFRARHTVSARTESTATGGLRSFPKTELSVARFLSHKLDGAVLY